MKTNADLIQEFKKAFAKKGGKVEKQFNYIVEVWNLNPEFRKSFNNDFYRCMESWKNKLVREYQELKEVA